MGSPRYFLEAISFEDLGKVTEVSPVSSGCDARPDAASEEETGKPDACVSAHNPFHFISISLHSFPCPLVKRTLATREELQIDHRGRLIQACRRLAGVAIGTFKLRATPSP